MHFLDVVFREICVEGLEGTTLSHLWECLARESANFPVLLDDFMKNLIFDQLKSADVSFYLLQSNLKFPKQINRSELSYLNNGIPYFKRWEGTVVPVKMVFTDSDKGCSAHFYKRKCINDRVHASSFTLKEAEKYGPIKFSTFLGLVTNS
ncbi:hypothetical protein Ciccas_004149 [Cichlidogyrus casuarinus]|uniref:General transcription factor 3C polypeptide 1 winged-helix domain-containing protein n=1 Tax=Cichlidogyrus casuarinus TaxID=1844966 RepID=A0ABD2QFQ6_9PLAT